MLIKKQDLPIVSIGFMNQIHDEDRKIINTIFEQILQYEETSSHTNKIKINVLFQKWFNHTVKHFSSEEKKMKEKNFPSYSEHKKEHIRALAEMHTVFSNWQEKSEILILKTYFTDILPIWIVQHIETMDLEAANFLNEH